MAEIIPTDAEVKSQYGGLAGVQPVAPITPVTTATPAQVFSPANVAQTTTAPVGPYDYSDPLKLRDRINAELGLNDVQKQYQDAIANLRSFDTGTTNQQFGMDQELNPLGVIRGEQATALGQRSLSRQGMADTAQTLADRYNAVQAQADAKFNILNTERQNLQQLMVSNPGAKIKYTDTIERASKKIAKHAESVAKDEYKKQLKSAAMQLGIKTAGSTKEIEKRLRKYYGTQAAYNAQIQQLEIRAKQIANRNASTSSAANILLANASNSLLASRGSDGKVDPNTYIQQRDNYLRSVKGATPADFDAQFGVLLSQDEQKNLGVSTSATRADNKSGGGLTAAQKDDLATLQTAKQLSNTLLSKYAANNNSLAGVGALGYGSVAGALFNVGVGTKEGEETRNLIGNIRGTIAKLRGGTSFTANEEALLNTYVPTVNDSPDKIATKLQGLNSFINEKANNLYTLSGVSDPFQQNAPTMQSQIQELINAGYSPEQIQLLTQ